MSIGNKIECTGCLREDLSCGTISILGQTLKMSIVRSTKKLHLTNRILAGSGCWAQSEGLPTTAVGKVGVPS
jgi:hypothetical protein